MEHSIGPFRTHTGAPGASWDAASTERFALQRQPHLPPRREPPARTQRTRRTVDLSSTTHRALDIWQRHAADRLGVARVTGQEVISALIEQLLTDPRLSAQIIRSIQMRRTHR